MAPIVIVRAATTPMITNGRKYFIALDDGIRFQNIRQNRPKIHGTSELGAPWYRDDQAGQQKCDCCRKEAIAAESVEEKGLHIEKPERGEEHHKQSHRQEHTGTLIPKGSKSRKCKHGKVSDRTDGCDRNASHFRVYAAEHSETVRGTT